MKGLLAILALAGLVAQAPAAEPIRIGVVNEISGPQAEAGRFTLNGIRLAVDEVNKAGGVLGRSIEVRVEDNGSTNPGTVLAFSKLASETNRVAGIIGPIRSTQIQAASPTIAKAGIPTMIGGTEPGLTKANNRWLFRARPNDSYSSRVIADFGVNTLKLRKWAIVHTTDAFGTGGKTALMAALKSHGIEPVLVQGYTANSQDFTPIVLAVKKSGADILGSYFTTAPDQGIFAKQMRQLGVNIAWVGSPAMIAVSALSLAGVALHGTYAITDFTLDASDLTRSFGQKYRERYGINPDTYASWAYDAVHILANAMRNAGSTEAEAVRSAILGLKGFQGVEGAYAFDASGDGLHGYNVVRNDKGAITFIKRVDFPTR